MKDPRCAQTDSNIIVIKKERKCHCDERGSFTSHMVREKNNTIYVKGLSIIATQNRGTVAHDI